MVVKLLERGRGGKPAGGESSSNACAFSESRHRGRGGGGERIYRRAQSHPRTNCDKFAKQAQGQHWLRARLTRVRAEVWTCRCTDRHCNQGFVGPWDVGVGATDLLERRLERLCVEGVGRVVRETTIASPHVRTTWTAKLGKRASKNAS